MSIKMVLKRYARVVVINCDCCRNIRFHVLSLVVRLPINDLGVTNNDVTLAAQFALLGDDLLNKAVITVLPFLTREDECKV